MLLCEFVIFVFDYTVLVLCFFKCLEWWVLFCFVDLVLCFEGIASARCLITRMTSWCSVRGARIGKNQCILLSLFTFIIIVDGFWLFGFVIVALGALLTWMKEFRGYFSSCRASLKAVDPKQKEE